MAGIQQPNMTAYRFDRLVELRRRSLTENGQGEQVQSWVEAYAQVWAAKYDLRGQKRYLAAQFITEQLTEFVIRWRDDVLMTDRLINTDDNAVYEIIQSSEVGRRQALDLLCRVIVL